MDSQPDPYHPPRSEVAQDAAPNEGSPAGDFPSSPLSGQALYWLFFNPSRFFSNPGWLLKTPELVLVAWIAGAAYATDQISTQLLKSDFGRENLAWEAIEPWLLDSWVSYWGIVVVYGSVSAVILWYVAGWWYRVRLRWSGDKDIEARHARAVYVYQDLVQSAPTLVLILLLPIWFANYAEYWAADELLSSAVIVFVVWSCITSYKAAVQLTSRKWPTMLWFLVLPLVVYLLALGVLGAVYYWFAVEGA